MLNISCFWHVFLYKNHDKNGIYLGQVFVNCSIRPIQNSVEPYGLSQMIALYRTSVLGDFFVHYPKPQRWNKR